MRMERSIALETSSGLSNLSGGMVKLGTDLRFPGMVALQAFATGKEPEQAKVITKREFSPYGLSMTRPWILDEWSGRIVCYLETPYDTNIKHCFLQFTSYSST